MKFLILRNSAMMRKLLDMIPTLLIYRATPSQEARALHTMPLPSVLSGSRRAKREGMDLSLVLHLPPPQITLHWTFLTGLIHVHLGVYVRILLTDGFGGEMLYVKG